MNRPIGAYRARDTAIAQNARGEECTEIHESMKGGYHIDISGSVIQCGQTHSHHGGTYSLNDNAAYICAECIDKMYGTEDQTRNNDGKPYAA